LGLPRIPWKWWRRAAQLFCLLGFLWLFRQTECDPFEGMPGAVNLLFRLDPLVAAAAVLAGAQFIASLWPALVVVALTLVLGRFFCGWVCPLGSLLDAVRHVLPRRERPGVPRWRVAKYFLLAAVLVSAIAGLQLVGYVDPFSILVRGLTVAVDPAFARLVTAPFAWLYRNAPESVTNISEPVYAFLQAYALPFQPGVFVWAGVSFFILGLVLSLEVFERRFWCRNLCPTGALLGLFARVSLLRRFPARVCGQCNAASDCGQSCRMGAFNEKALLSPDACNLCLDCVDDCPNALAKFAFGKPKTAPAPFEPSRRLFLASVATGLAMPAVAKAMGAGSRLPDDLLRPPGALPEADFLDRCVRCGECLKVCTTNALQPTMLESGMEGIFTPRLIPLIGYCEYNCTLCAEVCPTGAIARLPLKEKQEFVIGKAWFDENVCLPFAKAKDCIVCEEHCPTPEKAIQFKEVEVKNERGEKVIVKQPFVRVCLCNGCGICENKCPVQATPGVRVLRPGIVLHCKPGTGGRHEQPEAAGAR
jgi:polyferredoxin